MRVKLCQLTVTLASQIRLFDHFSCTFTGPGLYFIAGKNGVGKSTLLRVLAGESLPGRVISGSVVIDGHVYDLAAQKTRDYLYERVAYVPQRVDDMLASGCTGQENLAAACFSRYPGLSFFEHPASCVFDVPLTIPVRELSGGQRQLLAIAMALHKKPLMLLLDEPTAALDPANSVLVMDMIKQLSTNMLCVCICHDEDLIARYGQAAQVLRL